MVSTASIHNRQAEKSPGIIDRSLNAAKAKHIIIFLLLRKRMHRQSLLQTNEGGFIQMKRVEQYLTADFLSQLYDAVTVLPQSFRKCERERAHLSSADRQR